MGVLKVLSWKSGVNVGDDVLNVSIQLLCIILFCPDTVIAIKYHNIVPQIRQSPRVRHSRYCQFPPPLHSPKPLPLITNEIKNVTSSSSSTVVAALEAAYFAGKDVPNSDQTASISGTIATAHDIRVIPPAYRIPVILHTDPLRREAPPLAIRDGIYLQTRHYLLTMGNQLFIPHIIDQSEEDKDSQLPHHEEIPIPCGADEAVVRNRDQDCRRRGG